MYHRLKLTTRPVIVAINKVDIAAKGGASGSGAGAATPGKLLLRTYLHCMHYCIVWGLH